MASETLRTLRLSAEAFGRDPRAVEARVLELDRAARVRRALRIALPLVGPYDIREVAIRVLPQTAAADDLGSIDFHTRVLIK